MSPLEGEYRRFREVGGVIDLASRVKLLFTGADRARYLNGQVTANIASAKAPVVLPACVTTAKGKLCADVFVAIESWGILIDADPATADSLPARMERYIVADDVEVADVTTRAGLIHIVGAACDGIESPGITPVPVSRYGIPGYDLHAASREELTPAWELLTAKLPVLSEDLLEVIRIGQGMPRWGFELDENTLPSEAGLDRTHIDYQKGCYIGQEVISRLKSVGHVNRELSGFVSMNGTPLSRGARLCSADAPDRELGILTSTAHSFVLEQPIALGYLRRGAPREGLLAINPGEPDAPVPVAHHPLPFV